MKTPCRAVLLRVLISSYVVVVVVAAHDNSSIIDRDEKKTASNSILHKLWKRNIECPENEYYGENLCCKKCRAGTYVKSYCTVEHGEPECNGCIAGKNYMDKDNGLSSCHTCSHCDAEFGLKDLQACTVLHNTVCTCKENFFCVEDGNEESDVCTRCQHCTMCEYGYAKECTNKKDAVCNPQRHRYLVAVSIVLVILLCFFSWALMYFIANTDKKDKSAQLEQQFIEKTDKSAEPEKQPFIFPPELKDIDLTDYLNDFSDAMKIKTVLKAVRTMKLSEPRIDSITNDYKHDTDDQKYHLLLEWYQTHASKGAFQKLITTLHENKEEQTSEKLIKIARSRLPQNQSQGTFC